jgi:hypothetical protein
MDMGGIVQWPPWGLAVVALLGLSGCVPADRGWVREQLAPVQVQVAEVRDRVAVVEEQFARLDPKVDRILAQIEQRWQQDIASYQHPAGAHVTFPPPSPGEIPGDLPAEPSIDLTITGGATPLGGGITPPGALTVEIPAEARPRQEPRDLTEGQREQLLRTLREGPKMPLAVVAISGDNESYAFAKRLDMVFDVAGWPTQGVNQQTVSDVPPGLTFVTNSGDGAVFARAAGIQDTLHAMGIAAQSRALESMPEGVLMLVVGPQPR